MKIRLTKETLGLPVGTVLEFDPNPIVVKSGENDGTIVGSGQGAALSLRQGYWEEIPEPTEEDRLREEISRLEDIVEKQNSEIARLRSTGCTQNPSQGIERHMTAESHPDAPQVNTAPKYRMLEAGEVIQDSDECRAYNTEEWGDHMATGTKLLEENVGYYRRRLPDGA